LHGSSGLIDCFFKKKKKKNSMLFLVCLCPPPLQEIDLLFFFSQRLGANYTGVWSASGQELTITVTDADARDDEFVGTALVNPEAPLPSLTPLPPAVVGAMRVTVRGKRPWGRPLPGILDANGVSDAVTGISAVLGGTLGPSVGPGPGGDPTAGPGAPTVTAGGDGGSCVSCWLVPIVVAIVILAALFAIMAYQRHRGAHADAAVGPGTPGGDWGHGPVPAQAPVVPVLRTEAKQQRVNPGSWHMDLGL
jgi:hypothetical protein